MKDLNEKNKECLVFCTGDSTEVSKEDLINAIETFKGKEAMSEWKKTTKEYAIYCKEDRKEAWINAIDGLDIASFTDLKFSILAYEDQKRCFIKTAEIMKALDEGESWKQIGARLTEGNEYCQYPIGIIAHMMLAYSKHGIEFVEKLGDGILWILDALKQEYEEELAKESGQTLR